MLIVILSVLPDRKRSSDVGVGGRVVGELQPGDPQTIGPYRLVGRLGQGGMGQVFLGVSRGGRPVAVKAIRPELAADPGFRTRFGREVAAARRVSGMYTAMVVDADVDGPVAWLATAYVPGPSLAEAVDAYGPLPEASLVALAGGLAESLSAIHAAGVVHRDLKPSNVLLAEDGPRVIDFGISRAAETTALTQTGLVVGSPGFMSPEQAIGGHIGPPSDIFNLGAVLAFAATGEGPFGTGTTASLLYRVVHGTPELSQVPASVRPLIEHCLTKDPAQRPTADDLLGQVGALQVTDNWLPDSITRTFVRDAAAGAALSPSWPGFAGGGPTPVTPATPATPAPAAAAGAAAAAAAAAAGLAAAAGQGPVSGPVPPAGTAAASGTAPPTGMAPPAGAAPPTGMAPPSGALTRPDQVTGGDAATRPDAVVGPDPATQTAAAAGVGAGAPTSAWDSPYAAAAAGGAMTVPGSPRPPSSGDIRPDSPPDGPKRPRHRLLRPIVLGWVTGVVFAASGATAFALTSIAGHTPTQEQQSPAAQISPATVPASVGATGLGGPASGGTSPRTGTASPGSASLGPSTYASASGSASPSASPSGSASPSASTSASPSPTQSTPTSSPTTQPPTSAPPSSAPPSVSTSPSGAGGSPASVPASQPASPAPAGS
jgi:eukaryotic-like serine/threonine-protein kinase